MLVSLSPPPPTSLRKAYPDNLLGKTDNSYRTKFLKTYLKLDWWAALHSSFKISLFSDVFRLSVVDFFGEFYNLTLNTCIYKP